MLASVVSSVRPSNAPEGVSLVHRKSLIGFRAACEEVFGQAGYQSIREALPADVRERTAGMRPLPDWIPLEDLIAWHVALWNGPAKHDEKIMTEHIRRTVDLGFGRVKRVLITMATAESLAPRVAALWNDEYSTGTLEAGAVEPRSVQLMLRDHPYVGHQLMRFVIAEVFRYVLSMTRTKNITAVHAVRDGGLLVVLRWT
jgi:hypothetical protein